MSKKSKKFDLEISWNTLWRILVFFGIIALLYIAKEAIGILFIAIVISLAIEPAIGWLEKRGVNRILGVLITFFVVVFVFSAVVYFMIPPIISQAQSFLTQINDVVANFFGFGIPETVIEGVSSNLNQILGYLRASNISITGTISTVFNNLVFGITTLIIAFYLSAEKHGPERMIEMVLPRVYEGSVLRVFRKFKEKIRFWAVAQLGLSVIVGTVVTIGLWLMGVKYALILGVLAAVFELAPVIGPILSGIAAFLIAVAESFTLGIYVIVFFFVVQQLENNVLIPVMFKKSMKIHPVIVLVALLAGGQAAGLIGIILAVPVALLAQETLNYLAEQKASQARSKLDI